MCRRKPGMDEPCRYHLELPEGFELLATTDSIPIAAFKKNGTASTNPLYGVQFHPEVYHSIEGKKILNNFLVNICGCTQDWTPAHFITDTVEALKKQIGDRKVIMALSGGVDSTVAATLIHEPSAISCMGYLLTME